jgi:hypothetical protein
LRTRYNSIDSRIGHQGREGRGFDSDPGRKNPYYTFAFLMRKFAYFSNVNYTG